MFTTRTAPERDPEPMTPSFSIVVLPPPAPMGRRTRTRKRSASTTRPARPQNKGARKRSSRSTKH